MAPSRSTVPERARNLLDKEGFLAFPAPRAGWTGYPYRMNVGSIRALVCAASTVAAITGFRVTVFAVLSWATYYPELSFFFASLSASGFIGMLGAAWVADRSSA